MRFCWLLPPLLFPSARFTDGSQEDSTLGAFRDAAGGAEGAPG